ncbi:MULTISPECIES: potassium channel family protein [unclassified Nocardioides]|uniref:potassium channel family protein n=1 Tax=unclassified Nocardioides TaxID=2615069 RepID=UPI00138F995B|nr:MULTISPECIES: potassium channel family protein [unclassified Nocardioides]
MRSWRRVLRDFGLIGVALLVYFVVPVGFRSSSNVVEHGVISLVAIGLVGALVLWQVLLQVDDPSRRIDGLLLSMVAGVLVFALAFYRLHLEDPSQFFGMSTRIDSLYFTMTTLLTVGYGDINAAGQTARVMVLLQMVFNVVVIATAASTLNSRVRENAARRAEARRERRDA